MKRGKIQNCRSKLQLNMTCYLVLIADESCKGKPFGVLKANRNTPLSSLTSPWFGSHLIIIIMTLFKCQMYLARTALIGDTFQIELEFRNVGFWGEGKTGVPGEKPLGARTRTNNKLNPHMTPRPGIEPGPHWWEASALTTAHIPAPLILSIMRPRPSHEIKNNYFLKLV